VGSVRVAAAGCLAEALFMAAWYGIRSRQTRPPAPESTCPVCQLILRHQGGCPYAGLGMPQARAEHRRDHRTVPGAPGSPEASSEPERPR
jgi:hypothetical protein